ncbi:MAG: hypothetical protein WAU28_00205 [Candidatus Moraniibacteriota bacterium]
MNFETSIPAPEKEPRFLTLEEIKARIEKLCGQENPETVRTLEDEKGVYLHEVVTIDEKGDASLFSYRRSGNFQETKSAHTVIDAAYFIGPLADGMCVGGDTLSDYDENSGIWTDAK